MQAWLLPWGLGAVGLSHYGIAVVELILPSHNLPMGHHALTPAREGKAILPLLEPVEEGRLFPFPKVSLTGERSTNHGASDNNVKQGFQHQGRREKRGFHVLKIGGGTVRRDLRNGNSRRRAQDEV